MISSTFPYAKQTRSILGQMMAYVDEGQGEVIVRGLHTPQEDSPDQIGQATASWLKALG